MNKMVLFAAAAVVLYLSANVLRAEDDDQCPCIQAAKQVGIQGDQLKEITKLRNAAIANMAHIGGCAEMQALNAALDSAKKANNVKQAHEIMAKQKELLKPAMETFHKGVKALLGGDLYAKYNEKLPEFFKV